MIELSPNVLNCKFGFGIAALNEVLTAHRKGVSIADMAMAADTHESVIRAMLRRAVRNHVWSLAKLRNV